MIKTSFLLHIGIAASALVGLTCMAASHARATEDHEVKLKSIDEAPAAVREAARKVCGDATVKDVTREGDGARAHFEVECTKDGRACSVVLSAEGDVIEIERTVDAKQMPKVLAENISKKFPGATVGTVETIERHLYEIHLTSDGKKMSFEADSAGAIIVDEENENEKDEKDEDDEKGEKGEKKH